jgi:hypothetical protein
MRALAPLGAAVTTVVATALLLTACTSAGTPDTGALAQLAGGSSGANLTSTLGTAAWAVQHLSDLNALSDQLSSLDSDLPAGSASSVAAVCSALLTQSTKLIDQGLPPDPTVAGPLLSALQAVQTAARQCVSGDPGAALSQLQSAIAGLGALPVGP